MTPEGDVEEFFLEQDRLMEMSDEGSDEYLARMSSQRLLRKRPISTTSENVEGEQESNQRRRGSKRKQSEQSETLFSMDTERRHLKRNRQSQITSPIASTSDPFERHCPGSDVVIRATSENQPSAAVPETQGSLAIGIRPETYANPSDNPGIGELRQQRSALGSLDDSNQETSGKYNEAPEISVQMPSYRHGRGKTSRARARIVTPPSPQLQGSLIDGYSQIHQEDHSFPMLHTTGVGTSEAGNGKYFNKATLRNEASRQSLRSEVDFPPTDYSEELTDLASAAASQVTQQSRSDQSMFEPKGTAESRANTIQRDKVLKSSYRRMNASESSIGETSGLILDDYSSPSIEVSVGGLSSQQSKIASANSSTITTAANAQPVESSTAPLSSVAKQRKTLAKPAKQDKSSAKSKQKETKPVKGKKAKPQLTTPREYAQKLLEDAQSSASPSGDSKIIKFLAGKKIFYTGGDMKYAGATTRGRMALIIKYGGTLMPTYDPLVATHIITDADRRSTLNALGLQSLKNIPEDVPTVKWTWVLSGIRRADRAISRKNTKSQGTLEDEDLMEDVCLHAAFAQRIDAGSKLLASKGKGKAGKSIKKMKEKEGSARDDDASSQSDSTQDEPQDRPKLSAPDEAGKSDQKSLSVSNIDPPSGISKDPLAEFYALAKTEHENAWNGEGEESEAGDSGVEPDDQPIGGLAKRSLPKRGFVCDAKEGRSQTCANQDVIDKLEELMTLHKAKPSEDDRWRVFSYGKCIRTLRNYPTRIQSYAEARSIRGVGEKTALKIMEILETGNLRRIKYERTDDVEASNIFQGIYGVGRHTAFQWYACGCRNLEDIKTRKGGIKLSTCQEIGVKFYDDINSRMPRSEAEAIFNIIKPRALALDPKLFIEIMGSYRRGKADCGDIDILITRPIADGKTHAGLLKNLIRDLHGIGILTEDLALPDHWDELESIYRGLCRLPGEKSRRRRIDILAMPWISRGAALLYYTGDDIFNRSIRYKARSMGYSLNQRGLYSGIVRDPRNRQVKFNEGSIIASETEKEIFDILGVPWQEPHERMRG